ncbi:MAG: STAS/SEC14 domain-containing protein [Rhodobacterales bacterium]|nr:STAS/SEC14 domain-containing protein [Rhodobacterales bacterium]
MFKRMPSAPPGIVAFDAEGKITDSDYKTLLIPAIDAAKAAHGKVRALLRFGPAFEAYDAHAMLDDTMLGLTHWNDFERLAVVTDIDWIRHGVHLFGPLMPAKVRVFPGNELEGALGWTSA